MVWSLAARAGIAGARRYGLPAIRAAANWLRKSRADKGITVYRGEPAIPSSSLASVQKELGPGVGRWFSSDPKLAMKFAGRGTYDWHPRSWKKMWEVGGPKGFGYKKGVVKKLKLTKKEAELGRLLEAKLAKSKFVTPGYEYLIVPKKALSRVEKAPLRTYIANLRKYMGLYNKGGLARILEV